MATRQKTKTKKDEKIAFLETVLENNIEAKSNRKRKSWTMHDVANIKPLTPSQEDVFHAWINGFNLCIHGSAGTGKSFLALYLALCAVLNKEQQRIVIVRSAVPTRDIGFLPGTEEEKTEVYEEPYRQILWELVGGKNTYDDMKEAGLITFMSTSFIRGLTIDNAVVILDESQSNTFHELNSVLTRVGQNTRVICNGDIIQSDLNTGKESEGMTRAMKIFNSMKTEFALIEFTRDDIVRSGFVKSWIIADENLSRKIMWDGKDKPEIGDLCMALMIYPVDVVGYDGSKIVCKLHHSNKYESYDIRQLQPLEKDSFISDV